MRVLSHAMVSKIRCPPASEFRNPETRLSLRPACHARHERAGGGQAPCVLHQSWAGVSKERRPNPGDAMERVKGIDLQEMGKG